MAKTNDGVVCFVISEEQIQRHLGMSFKKLENESHKVTEIVRHRALSEAEILELRDSDVKKISQLEYKGQLGKGFFGNVDFVRNPKTNEYFAVKKQIIPNDAMEKRIMDQELLILKKCKHIFIVELVSIIEENSRLRFMLFQPLMR